MPIGAWPRVLASGLPSGSMGRLRDQRALLRGRDGGVSLNRADDCTPRKTQVIRTCVVKVRKGGLAENRDPIRERVPVIEIHHTRNLRLIVAHLRGGWHCIRLSPCRGCCRIPPSLRRLMIVMAELNVHHPRHCIRAVDDGSAIFNSSMLSIAALGIEFRSNNDRCRPLQPDKAQPGGHRSRQVSRWERNHAARWRMHRE